jgi:hypothetical protein
LGVVSHTGTLEWDFTIPNYASAFRGAAIADVNGDDTLDVAFGTGNGTLHVLHGADGSVLWDINLENHYGSNFEIDHGPIENHYGSNFEIDHGPILGDFDGNDTMDLFVVGGHAEYPAIENNYGRAYAIKAGPGNGPGWTMFRRDERRSAAIPMSSVGIEESQSTLPPYFIFPNPVQDRISVVWEQNSQEHIRIKLLDLQGRMVSQLYQGVEESGIRKLELTLSDIPTGMYVLEIERGGREYYERLILD